MSDYPYAPQPPPPGGPPLIEPASKPSRAQTVWMWICIGGLVAAGLEFALSKFLGAFAPEPRSAAFLIVNGLLALIGLTSWTIVGIAAIGWIVSRALAKKS